LRSFGVCAVEFRARGLRTVEAAAYNRECVTVNVLIPRLTINADNASISHQYLQSCDTSILRDLRRFSESPARDMGRAL
jgi:hypothetical protein